MVLLFFFFNDTATTEIYTLSLHDALPILMKCVMGIVRPTRGSVVLSLDNRQYDLTRLSTEEIVNLGVAMVPEGDRKSTRLNSSHTVISYAAFCLKKKKERPPHSPAWSPPL